MTDIEIIRSRCLEFAGRCPTDIKLLSRVGRWLRISKNTALKLYSHDGFYIGILKNHRTGELQKFTTCTSSKPLMTPQERAKAQQQRRELAQQEEARRKRKERMLSGLARRVWKASLKPSQWRNPHPYLVKKNVQPYNIRRFTSHKRDVLMLPMACPFAGLRSLYLIYPGGFKRPLKGSQTKGLCMAIGSKLDAAQVIWIVEGWATGASLHEQTGQPVVVAFTAGNLEAVTRKIVQKYPGADVRVCADDDRATDLRTGDNPGINYARKVQQVCPQVALYKPIFPPGAPDGLSDVNDLINWKRQQEGRA